MAQWIGDKYSWYKLGDVGFLVEQVNKHGVKTYSLENHPPRTNESREAKLTGWCGESYDVATYARGMARVVKVAKNGRAHVLAITGTDLEEQLELHGYPDLG